MDWVTRFLSQASISDFERKSTEMQKSMDNTRYWPTMCYVSARYRTTEPSSGSRAAHDPSWQISFPKYCSWPDQSDLFWSYISSRYGNVTPLTTEPHSCGMSRSSRLSLCVPVFVLWALFYLLYYPSPRAISEKLSCKHFSIVQGGE